ncbi:MAG: hypothetical protein U9R27_11125 [Campylobacterota bacterium]|nr:hypothetical protein [Campylobacterota bacterium]
MSHNPKITTIQTPEETTNYNYLCQNNISSITKDNESFNFTYDGKLFTQIKQSTLRGVEYTLFPFTILQTKEKNVDVLVCIFYIAIFP